MPTDTSKDSALQPLLQPLDDAQKREFLWNIYTSTNNYLQFADTKAAFCVGISSAFIGALFVAKAQLIFTNGGPKTLTGFVSLGAFLLLAASMAASVAVVRPRPWKPEENKFVFWDGIATQFELAQSFVHDFGEQTDAELTSHLARDVHDLATVCHRKYGWVNVATFAAAAGTGLAIIALLFNKAG
jgi:Family of unknown function (DUF5706)